jgi:hypothetical protein
LRASSLIKSEDASNPAFVYAADHGLDPARLQVGAGKDRHIQSRSSNGGNHCAGLGDQAQILLVHHGRCPRSLCPPWVLTRNAWQIQNNKRFSGLMSFLPTRSVLSGRCRENVHVEGRPANDRAKARVGLPVIQLGDCERPCGFAVLAIRSTADF